MNQRRRNANYLAGRFRDIDALRVAEPGSQIFHSYYKYYVFVRPERLNQEWSRDRVMEAVNEAGVPCMTGICPEIYLERVFEKSESRPKYRLPNARELSETSLMFQVHPTMTISEMEKISVVVKDVFEKYAGKKHFS